MGWCCASHRGGDGARLGATTGSETTFLRGLDGPLLRLPDGLPGFLLASGKNCSIVPLFSVSADSTSSFIGSTVDTFIFFSISFYGTGIPWITLSLGDLAVKIFVALLMLIPFRLLIGTLKAVKA